MKTRKAKAIIVAMAAVTGASVSATNAAAKAAMADMKEEFGNDNVVGLEYTYDPFEGMWA